ncbi:MAG: hypothetical protein WKF89_13100 [Chitinophagaceae bacterium]
MNKELLSIATITWARTASEDKLLRTSLQELAKLQIPVFICDGGSGKAFTDFLNNFPHFTLLPRKAAGVWWQVKISIQAAYESGSAYILYTEPDKYEFFNTSLPGFLDNEEANEQNGVMLASRSAQAFNSFPAFQKSTETTINFCCSEITGKPLDYTYGPFLFNRKLVPYFDLVQEDIGWGWRPFVFGIAKRLGYEITQQVGNFACPVDQRADDSKERIYRMRQLSQNIEGIVLSTSVIV